MMLWGVREWTLGSNPYDQYQSYRSYEDRARKQPAKPNFDTRFLGTTMRAIGSQHKVTKISEDTVNYLALSLRARLQDLITAMIDASAHRTDAQFDRPASLYEDGSPMWSVVVRSDVAKQLAAIERVEREEEMRVRRERKERAEAAAAAQSAALAAQNAAGTSVDGEDGEGGPKKKKKKDGPGVTARNMSEDTRKKMSNAVAAQAAGLSTGKYAWMTQANAAAPPPKPKPIATSGSATTPATTTAPSPSATAAGGWARPYVPTKQTQSQMQDEKDMRRAITMRDALFVIEKERGHGEVVGDRNATSALRLREDLSGSTDRAAAGMTLLVSYPPASSSHPDHRGGEVRIWNIGVQDQSSPTNKDNDTTTDTRTTLEMQAIHRLPVSICAARRLNAYNVPYRLPTEILWEIFLFAAAKYREKNHCIGVSAPASTLAPLLKCATSLRHFVINQSHNIPIPTEFTRALRSMQDLETLSLIGIFILPQEGMGAIHLSRLRSIRLACSPSLSAEHLTMLSPSSDVRVKFDWHTYDCISGKIRNMQSLQVVLSPIISPCTTVSIRKPTNEIPHIIVSYRDASQEPLRTLIDLELASLVIWIRGPENLQQEALGWLCRLLPLEQIRTLELATGNVHVMRAKGAWKKRLKNVTVVRTTAYTIGRHRILEDLWAVPRLGFLSRDQVTDDELFFIPRLEALQIVDSDDKSKESDHMEEILRQRRCVLDEWHQMSTGSISVRMYMGETSSFHYVKGHELNDYSDSDKRFLQVLVHEDAIFAQNVLARRPPQIAGVPMIRYKRVRISHRHHLLMILVLEGIPWSTFDFANLAVAFVANWQIDVDVAACGHLDQRFFETDRNIAENSRLTPDFRYRRGTPITAPYLGKSAIPRPKMPSTPSHMRRGPWSD
ncbi:predicted protein [Postia placenta Mad-698-R]|uniref:Transcription initiation factor TFIID subunit 4 n=1 Tax=Postia placenta MAD-698-R-SB12 TaxID=670580 RepID=A0A1X6MT43_9APHY|nr:hypothetical protein POSPLADRAFT_1150740 [Postia placenta MAD-698-R-SB12]EED79269.1 predicted protein [Postia placenta Mad-698-R]OSX59561.1 hypothetical protein POSPLADRAFT_1150740 [Postia placenta MAD-698-R-SB12]